MLDKLREVFGKERVATADSSLACFSECYASLVGLRPREKNSADQRLLVADTKPDVSSSTESDPKADTRLTGNELSSLLKPPKGGLLEKLHDVSSISAAGNSIPEGRRATGQYDKNEDLWLAEFDERIKNGDIDKNTLVIGFTGHNLTIAAKMAQAFGSDIYQCCPKDSLFKVNQKRLQDQAQTFAQATKNALEKVPKQGASTFLGVDCHMGKGFPEGFVQNLPDPENLKKAGISKIFVAWEEPHVSTPAVELKDPFKSSLIPAENDKPRPGLTTAQEKFSPIYEWLEKCHKAGITVCEACTDRRDRDEVMREAKEKAERSYGPVLQAIDSIKEGEKVIPDSLAQYIQSKIESVVEIFGITPERAALDLSAVLNERLEAKQSRNRVRPVEVKGKWTLEVYALAK